MPGEGTERELARRLRLIVLTDHDSAAPRSVRDVAAAALDGGAPAIQLRDKVASAAALYGLARDLRALTARYGALLFVNDRLDVALAAGADGVHLGPDDVPVFAARRAVPPGFLIGYSTDDPELAVAAESAGADYIGCGAVFPTSTKPDAGGVVGLPGLDAVARAVGIPVVGIGGITPAGARRVAAETAAAGVAAASVVMASPDPAETVRALLAAWPAPIWRTGADARSRRRR